MRRASAEVVPRARFLGAGGLDGRHLALDAGDEALVVALPAERPVILSVTLPPAGAEDFARWVAQRTNVVIGEGGAVTLGEVPRTLL